MLFAAQSKQTDSILKIIFVRHAESFENLYFETLGKMFRPQSERRVSVRESLKVFFGKGMRDSEITALGQKMAQDVAQQIQQASSLPWTTIDAYWHSPFQRTAQTLGILFPGK